MISYSFVIIECNEFLLQVHYLTKAKGRKSIVTSKNRERNFSIWRWIIIFIEYFNKMN
jgi:hypothetical protein